MQPRWLMITVWVYGVQDKCWHCCNYNVDLSLFEFLDTYVVDWKGNTSIMTEIFPHLLFFFCFLMIAQFQLHIQTLQYKLLMRSEAPSCIVVTFNQSELGLHCSGQLLIWLEWIRPTVQNYVNTGTLFICDERVNVGAVCRGFHLFTPAWQYFFWLIDYSQNKINTFCPSSFC